MPHFSEIIQSSSSCQFKLTETEIFVIFPLKYQHNTKVLTANSSLDVNNIPSSFLTQLSDQTPKKLM